MTWLRALRLSAREHADELRAAWARGPHSAIDTFLAEPPAPSRDESAAWTAAFAEPRWARLIAEFSLTRVEAQFLALLCAVQAEPGWRRLLGYLEDDTRPTDPTPAIAAGLFGWAATERPAPSGAVARWQLASPLGPWLPTTPWAADPDIAAYVAGGEEWATFWPGLDRPATRGAQASGAAEALYADTLAALERAARALPFAELELIGRPGSGRRTLLTRLCARLNREALMIGPDAPPVKALRAARLLNAVPVWVDADALAHDGLTLTAREARDPRPSRTPRMTFELPELTNRQRAILWGDTPAPHAIRQWALTPAEIATAKQAAPAGEAAVTQVARRRVAGVASALMTAVSPVYDWDDLIVADGVQEQLRDLERQVRDSAAVLDEWGFRRLTPRSRGVTALFAGPSGTGKTMAAQVLAKALELDLYQVDLAEVVNKYIGETEKRLAQVFDECERGNVMVLFDEADALFGQRTRVRDAHDRFANIEIDYLLQRMESFNGVAILATNRRGDLDPAFLRRIRTIVDFLAPTASERKRLWELAVPADPRFANGVDRAWLADELKLTGAEIKSVALAAAFRAHGKGELIGTEHVLAAARRELAKKGTVVR